jgi:hypothetical protein
LLWWSDDLYVGHRTDCAFEPSLGYAAQENSKPTGDLMEETSDALWLAFEAMAKTYPHDNGVRLTADLARWLLAEHQRQQLPVPLIVNNIVRTAKNPFVDAEFGHGAPH